MTRNIEYKRILIKLSGEALKGDAPAGYEGSAIRNVVGQIKKLLDLGAEVALVVGAGNLWRGVNGASDGMDRVNADRMGMLATVMNGLCLRDFFALEGIGAQVFSAISIPGWVAPFNRDAAVAALEAGQVVIFVGGTGNPYFTTDSASALRALEIDCDAVIKATKVDGVYSADPFKDPTAVRFDELSFDEVLSRRLAIMDQTAFSLCRDNQLPIIVADFDNPAALEKILLGDTSVGTIIH